MKYTKSSVYCLLVALSAMPVASDGAIRVGNLSRNNAAANAQQQSANARYQTSAYAQQVAAATPQGAVSATPMPVTETAEPEYIDPCTQIYPDGEFERARPTSGVGMGGAETCTAVVHMRVLGANRDGSDAIVLRANLAAGEAFRCNVSDFHESTYLPEAENVTFPGDREPTIEDVTAALNQEQKQNAAMKIIGTAVVGALGGNIAGANKPGTDGLLGGGKDKIKGTVIGALGGAALGTASTFSGKVAGDVIMSAGMNAAAGSVVGNIAAKGKSVLKIESCTIDDGNGAKQETQCLWGILENTETLGAGSSYVLNKVGTRTFRHCIEKEGVSKCEVMDLTDVKVPGYDGDVSATSSTTEQTDEAKAEDKENKAEKENAKTDAAASSDTKNADAAAEAEKKANNANKVDVKITGLENILKDNFNKTPNQYKYCYVNGEMRPKESACADGEWIRLISANKVSQRVPAMIVGVHDKAFGWKQEDWPGKFLEGHGGGKSFKFIGRTGGGDATSLPDGMIASVDNFTPVYLDAEDGGVIDMDNKARLGGTLTGAGVGGAVGAYSAYQGAQNEIDTRWVAAKREYKDSLQKVVCMTGNRFLGYYNDTILIPAPAEE